MVSEYRFWSVPLVKSLRQLFLSIVAIVIPRTYPCFRLAIIMESSAPGSPSLLASNKPNDPPKAPRSIADSTNNIPAFNLSTVPVEALKRLLPKTKLLPGMYALMPTILTRISIDITPTTQENVLVFISNPTLSSTPRTGVYSKGSSKKPDFIAFLTDRNTAARVARGNLSHREKKSIMPHSECSLSSIVEVTMNGAKHDPTNLCLRHLSVLSHHKPGSFIHYGLVFDTFWFQLVSLQLEKYKTWPEVYWTDEGYIEELCRYLSIIIEETGRNFLPEVPALVSAFNVGSRTMGTYSVCIHGEKYFLLPIFAGRGGSCRKALVAIGHKEGRNDDKRIFKYSWHKGDQLGKESSILKDLKGTPGVVQIDEDLSNDSIETDPNSGRTRTLVVLRTVGQSLGSCRTVQEFLEAMYDLLEGNTFCPEIIKQYICHFRD